MVAGTNNLLGYVPRFAVLLVGPVSSLLRPLN